jgi:hypothetical protein
MDASRARNGTVVVSKGRSPLTVTVMRDDSGESAERLTDVRRFTVTQPGVTGISHRAGDARFSTSAATAATENRRAAEQLQKTSRATKKNPRRRRRGAALSH